MDEFLSSNTPDTPTPLNSAGQPSQGYRNAAGDFDLKRELRRKIKSRKDLAQPAFAEDGPMTTPGGGNDNSTDRYFGSFSVESKRHVWDLLQKHPEFGQKSNVRINRVGNNTREVLPNDPTKTLTTGGDIVYNNVPQSSQSKY